jgi:phosphopantetheinyl transferase
MAKVKIVASNRPFAALRPHTALLTWASLDSAPEPRQSVREAANQFSSTRRQLEFTASRELLLSVSSELLLEAIELEELSTLYNGKIAFKSQRHEHLQFNLSHSRQSVALLFSNCGAVGVDCEQISRFSKGVTSRESKWLKDIEIEQLKQKTLQDLEIAKWLCLLWTRKEAVTKLKGRGFADGFAKLYMLRAPQSVLSFSLPGEFVTAALPDKVAELIITPPLEAFTSISEVKMTPD